MSRKVLTKQGKIVISLIFLIVVFFISLGGYEVISSVVIGIKEYKIEKEKEEKERLIKDLEEPNND